MSNAPKTGFWQTVPGLITATAGFLSAATGAIVVLNQTGVVDLKKMAGTKPNETVWTNVDLAPQRFTERESPETQAPVASKSTDASPPPVAESKPQNPPLPAPTASATEAEKLKAIREGAAAASKKHEGEPPATSAPTTTKRESSPPVPAGERVVETKPQPVRPAPSAPARETEKPTPPANPKPVEAAPQVVKAPPSPSAQDKAPAPRPDPKERMVDARNPDRDSGRPATTDDNAKRERIVRPGPDTVATRGGSKRLGTDDEPGMRKGPEGVREARSAAASGDRQLDLTGLRMTLPSGWVKEEVQAGPMAPVAALRIPDPAGDGTVQITRYLGAKGKEMEDRSIERWVGQVTKANGAPMSLADAKIERRQVGPVRITTVELSGTVKMTSRDTGEPGSRMISAIVDHPAGPHLVTIVGPARSMAKWDAAIDEFLKSAKPE